MSTADFLANDTVFLFEISEICGKILCELIGDFLWQSEKTENSITSIIV